MPNSSSFRTTSPTLNPRRAARSPTATGPLRVISVGSTTVASAGASTLGAARRVRRSAWNRRGGGGGGRRPSGGLGGPGGVARRGGGTRRGGGRGAGGENWGGGGAGGGRRRRRTCRGLLHGGRLRGPGGPQRGDGRDFCGRFHGRRRDLPNRDNPPSRRCLHVRPRRSGGRGRGRGLAAARVHLLAGTADDALVQRRGVTLHRNLQAGEQVDQLLAAQP